jgi:REP element-mobilizing transposase RayT
MATKRRMLYPGAIGHVTVHSLDDLWPFEDDLERELCLVRFDLAFRTHRIECHAYVVMSNHFHLCLRMPEGGLPEAMQDVNSWLAKRYNRRRGRRGPVLVAPYHLELIEEQSHLLEVIRYDVLNPVRAGMVADPADYRWSSYRATAGLAPRPRFLATEWTLAQLGGPDRYRRFVAEGLPAATVPGLLLAA